MHTQNKYPENLVSTHYSLENYEQMIRNELVIAFNRAGCSKAQADKMMRIVNSVLQQFKSRRFAVTGQLDLYQYPLMSLSASGKFNDRERGMIVYVHKTSQRRAYQRKWVIPKDPKTEKQLTCRERMRLMNQQWKNESDPTREAWNQAAHKYPAMTGKNLYARYWFRNLQEHQEPPGIGVIPVE